MAACPIPRRTVPAHVQVEALVPATPDAVYDAVADVRAMGRWSPEATGATVAVERPLAVGDRFTGHNRNGLARWSTTCTVVAADRGRRFCFDVSFAGIPIARWDYAFEPDADGTRIVESWWDRRSGLPGGVMRLAGYVIIPERDRGEHNRRTMRATLDRLREHFSAAARPA